MSSRLHRKSRRYREQARLTSITARRDSSRLVSSTCVYDVDRLCELRGCKSTSGQEGVARTIGRSVRLHWQLTYTVSKQYHLAFPKGFSAYGGSHADTAMRRRSLSVTTSTSLCLMVARMGKMGLRERLLRSVCSSNTHGVTNRIYMPRDKTSKRSCSFALHRQF